MTELIVVSGKGGTGKTSLVGSLAALSQNKVLVDCDVDAADLHLILQHNVLRTTKFIGGKQASIIEERCTNCGLCEEFCRFDAIKHKSPSDLDGEEKYWIDKHACDGCAACVRHCPEQAIDFKEVISGDWFLSETPHGPLLHARLGLAQANSGKLVSLLRQQARLMAEKRGLDLIIVDGPPGIGCPVIASITGATYVLIVTEPSMSAMHDMERLLQLTTHFRMPTGICINRSDINHDLTSRIENFAKKQKVNTLGRIPFDPAVTQAQLEGTSVIEHVTNGASKNISLMWSNLENELRKKGS
ncbi:MAG: ATP-binding protein [candidate division Zixibacteria bacterium]|nr:ATP-binding protein [candidate division Zixibacteria bacterium]